MVVGGGWVDQAITDPISGPSFDFTFSFGPELDNNIRNRKYVWTD